MESLRWSSAHVNPSTKWRWVLSLTPWPVNFWYQLVRKLDGLWIRWYVPTSHTNILFSSSGPWRWTAFTIECTQRHNTGKFSYTPPHPPALSDITGTYSHCPNSLNERKNERVSNVAEITQMHKGWMTVIYYWIRCRNIVWCQSCVFMPVSKFYVSVKFIVNGHSWTWLTDVPLLL